jgi:nucleotide-binding universal stress UspA family protein
MKILCPTDFSNCSVNACRWATQFLGNLGGGQLELLHCINIVSRSAMFIKLDDVYRERAEEDLSELIKALQAITPLVAITAKVVKSDPKNFLPDYLKRKDFDLVVTGTKGLTALKDMTVGSVTAHLIDRSEVPVLTIPAKSAYTPVKQLVLGVDNQSLVKKDALAPLLKMLDRSTAQLQVVHTLKEEESASELHPEVAAELAGVSYQFSNISANNSVAQALTQFCHSHDADILVLVHRQRQWWERLFYNSLTKSSLFEIELPFLIIPV